MGAIVSTYCDGCGVDVGQGTLDQAISINAVGTSGVTTQILLCLQQEVIEEPLAEQPGGEAHDPNHRPYTRNVGKITGCARKVLAKTMLARLYEDVAEYTGDDSIRPFPL